MAVARVSTGAGNQTTGSSATLATSWSHTVASSGANTFVLIGFNQSVSTNASDTGSTVTYGGQACSLVTESLVGISTTRARAAIYSIVNPPTGAQTVSVTSTGTGTKTRVSGQSVAYSGVASLGTPAVWVTANLSVSLTGATTSMLFAVHGNGSQLTAVNQTQQFLSFTSVGGAGDSLAVQDAAGTGSPTTFTATGTAATAQCGAVELVAAASAPVGKSFTRLQAVNRAGAY